jgi:transcriptional regulator with XRE-family HTH domain
MTKQGGWASTSFGGRLKELRETAGLTQKQLAEKASCNAFTVAKLERGVQEPAWPLVLALADALGVSTEEFRKPAKATPEPRRGRPPKVTAKLPASRPKQDGRKSRKEK